MFSNIVGGQLMQNVVAFGSKSVDVHWHSCNLCGQQFKSASNLKQHRASAPDVDVQ